MQIVIVAGGGGTRLWPISTPKKPKQFVGILDETSLLERTYKNLIKAFSRDCIWVSTNNEHKKLVKNILPKNFSDKKIIIEPSKRDNFAAVCGAAAVLASKVGDNEPLIFIPCDDFLPNQKSIDNFNKSLKKIEDSLNKKEFDIITTGIKPTYPNTNYGYIKIGEKEDLNCFQRPVPVKSFKEKPSKKTAKRLFDTGNYLWNKFNNAFTFNSLVKNLQKIDPKTSGIIKKFRKTGEIDENLYNKIPKTSFSKTFLEKVKKLGVIGLDVQWDDIGSWDIVEKYLPEIKKNINQVQFSGTGNKIKLSDSNKKVAFVGVSNLMLIESEEGILVIDPRNTKDIKKVSKYFEETNNKI